MTDLRELLILALALLILFSLLRAVYVVHRRRKGQIRLSIDKTNIEEAELTEPEYPELPNGGARSVSVEASGEPASGRAAESDAGDPLAGENVPILLDPVAVESADESVPETRESPPGKRKKNWREEILGSNGEDLTPSDFDLDLGAVSMTAGERIGSDSPKRAGPAETTAPAKPRPEPEQAEQAVEATRFERAAKPARPEKEVDDPVESESESESESDAVEADKIIAINVIAGEDRVFNGRELWDFLHAAGLRHDKMKILSKTEGNREDGKPIFRVANIVNPGTFDADAIDDFNTPGISMFMLLPAPINNLLAFEQMLAVARRLAEALDGRLLDFKRREMTAGEIEQARRRIREFDMGTAGSPSVSNGI